MEVARFEAGHLGVEFADVFGVALELVGAGERCGEGHTGPADLVEQAFPARAVAGIARIRRARVLGVVGMGERRLKRRGRGAATARVVRPLRSEERRVGRECRSEKSPDAEQQSYKETDE